MKRLFSFFALFWLLLCAYAANVSTWFRQQSAPPDKNTTDYQDNAPPSSIWQTVSKYVPIPPLTRIEQLTIKRLSPNILHRYGLRTA